MDEVAFRADRQESGLYGVGALTLSIACFALAQANWTYWLVAGIAVFLALVFAGAAAVLIYRFVIHPEMVRIGHDGIWLKRLAVTIPWDAIARVDRAEYKGRPLLAIIERDGGHPVFDEQALILGAALNAKAGLPPLAISTDGLEASIDEIASALASYGYTPVDAPQTQAV